MKLELTMKGWKGQLLRIAKECRITRVGASHSPVWIDIDFGKRKERGVEAT
jgi:hypothetical protein